MQEAFERDVRSLANTIEEMGSPFTENSSDLLALDSRDIANSAVIDTVRQIEKLGEEQYDAYVKERLVSQTKPISDPIKKNNLPPFSRPPVREKTKSQLQVTSLRNDRSHFLGCTSHHKCVKGIWMNFSNVKIKHTNQCHHKMEN